MDNNEKKIDEVTEIEGIETNVESGVTPEIPVTKPKTTGFFKMIKSLGKKHLIAIISSLAVVTTATVGIVVGTTVGGKNNGDGSTTPCVHTYGEWVVDDEATCTTEGSKHRDCTLCDEQETASISMTEHTVVVDQAVAPTCTETGLTEGSHCSECDKVFVAQQEIAKADHMYDDDYDESCNSCDHIRDVECLHVETVTISGYKATCTVPGKTDGKRCKDCQDVLVPQQTIPAPGHSFVNYSCDVCHTAQPAGLYDENENLVASWDELVNVYGLDIEKDYSSFSNNENHYIKVPSSGYNVFSKPELAGAVKLIIKEGVTSIGDGALGSCEMLTCISIPEGVLSIGVDSFVGCHGLLSIDIPDSVTQIDDDAFRSCRKLQKINFGEESKLEIIGSGAFSYCYDLENLVIPNSVKHIESCIISHCEKITSFNIPKNVEYIHSQAFSFNEFLAEITVDEDNPYFCSIDGNLYDKDASVLIRYTPGKPDFYFVIPDSVTYVECDAFDSAVNLSSLKIGANVCNIMNHNFNGCSSLVNIEVDENNTTYCAIDGNLYEKGDYDWEINSYYLILVKYAPGKIDKHFKVPANVTAIGFGAFMDNTYIESVDISDVELIDTWVFLGCYSLKALFISENLEMVGEDAFSFDSPIEVYYKGSQEEWDLIDIYVDEDGGNDAILNANVYFEYTSTDGFSFADNGDGTYSVDGISFYGEDFERSFIIIPSEYEGQPVTGIAPYAFATHNYYDDYLREKTVIIPEGVTTIGNYAFENSSVKYVYIPKSVTTIGNYAFYHSYITQISIHAGVTLGERVFAECYELTTLYVNMETIEDYEFECIYNLRTIYIGENVQYIAPQAFYDDTFIEKYIVSGMNPYYTSIDGNLYDKTGNSLILYAVGKENGMFVIPHGVTEIGYYAFFDSYYLNSVVIPKTVTYIGYGAFGQMENLTDLYYEGTEEEWNQNVDFNDISLNVTIHFNYTV